MQDVYNIHIFMILWDTITKQDFIVTDSEMQDVYNIHIFMILWDTITKQDFIVSVVKINSSNIRQ